MIDCIDCVTQLVRHQERYHYYGRAPFERGQAAAWQARNMARLSLYGVHAMPCGIAKALAGAGATTPAKTMCLRSNVPRDLLL